MGNNHVAFDIVQGKIPFGVPQRPLCMYKAVSAVASVLNVPVVEIIVVQQRPSDKGAFIRMKSQPSGYMKAASCDMEGMVIYADMSVMRELLCLRHSRRTENITAKVKQIIGQTSGTCRLIWRLFVSKLKIHPSNTFADHVWSSPR